MSATVSDTARASRQGEIALPRPRTTWTGTPRRAAASVRLPSSPTPRANSKRSANPAIRSRTCDCAPPCTARVIRTRSRGGPGARRDAGSRAGASPAPTWLGKVPLLGRGGPCGRPRLGGTRCDGVLRAGGERPPLRECLMRGALRVAQLRAARGAPPSRLRATAVTPRRRRRASAGRPPHGEPSAVPPYMCGAHRRGAQVPLSVARPPSAARDSRHARRRRRAGGAPAPRECRCGAPAPRERRCGARWRGAQDPLSVARPAPAARDSRHARRRRRAGGAPAPRECRCGAPAPRERRCGARWRGAQDPLSVARPAPAARDSHHARRGRRAGGAPAPRECRCGAHRAGQKIRFPWRGRPRPRATAITPDVVAGRAGRPPHETVFGRGNRPGLKDTPCGRGVE